MALPPLIRKATSRPPGQRAVFQSSARPAVLGTGRRGALLLLLAFALSPVCCQGQVVDRVAAVVRNEVITLSDINWLIRYQRMAVPEEPEGRRGLYESVLERVIDQKLIAQEALQTPGIEITASQVEARLQGFRGQFQSEVDFQQRLSELQMSLSDLRELFHRQLAVLAFVKLRFEPFIIVVPDQIQQYYEEELLPELEQESQVAPPLELLEEQIREILTVERTNQEMDGWVRNARRKANIHVLLFREPSFAPNLPKGSGEAVELQPLGEKTP